jgi:hypothetical protein
LAPKADDADEVRANILAYEKASGQAPPDPPAPAPDKKAPPLSGRDVWFPISSVSYF